MEKRIEKAFAISDAMITFVSLVDRPANKRPFCIVKAEMKQRRFRFAMSAPPCCVGLFC